MAHGETALLTWLGIGVCLAHSAMFSGLNLGLFGLSRLRLEVQAEAGSADAQRILDLRKDAHGLLATILWGNVGVNVLLTLLTDSVLPVVSAFLFSVFGITFFGEIIPQAYFARHVLKSSKVLVPIMRFYQLLLSPLAKPSGLLMDALLGKEQVTFFQEEEVEVFLRRHAQSSQTDVGYLESRGAANFLKLDDVRVREEGEAISPVSILPLPMTKRGLPVFPSIDQDPEDPFLKRIAESGEKWVIITSEQGEPILCLDADQYLRGMIYNEEPKNILTCCHRPIVVTDPEERLGEAILRFTVDSRDPQDHVVDKDIILYWGDQKRIIAGADILGRLLRGIVRRQ